MMPAFTPVVTQMVLWLSTKKYTSPGDKNKVEALDSEWEKTKQYLFEHGGKAKDKPDATQGKESHDHQ